MWSGHARPRGLIADGGDTIVILTHRDLPPPDREPSHLEGWERCLTELVSVLGQRR